MKKIEIQSVFTEYESADELNAEDNNLIDEARKCVMNAYAPYSQFRVGAAVLLENGKIILGNNQENASYPLGLCAERVAVFGAAANYPNVKIKAIAVTASSKQFIIDKPITPCGACRQAIAEYEHLFQNPIRLILFGEKGKILVTESISNLLPYQFTADDLKIKR